MELPLLTYFSMLNTAALLAHLSYLEKKSKFSKLKIYKHGRSQLSPSCLEIKVLHVVVQNCIYMKV